jgi:hypothetical protein
MALIECEKHGGDVTYPGWWNPLVCMLQIGIWLCGNWRNKELEEMEDAANNQHKGSHSRMDQSNSPWQDQGGQCASLLPKLGI